MAASDSSRHRRMPATAAAGQLGRRTERRPTGARQLCPGDIPVRPSSIAGSAALDGSYGACARDGSASKRDHLVRMVTMSYVSPTRGSTSNEQRGRAPGSCPAVGRFVERVIEPGDDAITDVGVDGGNLEVRVKRRGRHRQSGHWIEADERGAVTVQILRAPRCPGEVVVRRKLPEPLGVVSVEPYWFVAWG
jgi:hypothetical protein